MERNAYPPEYDAVIPELDWDTCPAISEGDVTVHYGALTDGVNWFACVELDAGHFTHEWEPEKCEDEGAAHLTARYTALQWLFENPPEVFA